MKRILFFIFIVLILLLFTVNVYASEDCTVGDDACTVTCDNDSDGIDINQAISDVAEDAVITLSGTCDVDSQVLVNKSLTLTGDGSVTWTGTPGSSGSSASYSGTTVWNVGIASSLKISLPSDVKVVITGIYFDGTINRLLTPLQIDGKINGSFGYSKIRIHDNKFDQGGGGLGQIDSKGWVDSVIDNNVFYDHSRAAVSVRGADEDAAWSRWVTTVESGKKTLQAGTEHALFIEDNYFLLPSDAASMHSAIYTQESARWVARYNTFDSSAWIRAANGAYSELDSHGNQKNYSSETGSLKRGQSIVEIYNNHNTIDKDAEIMSLRGGSLLFYNNTYVTSGSTPYINAVEQENADPTSYASLATDQIYPFEDQVHNTFFWNNTGVTFYVTTYSQSYILENKSWFLHAPESSGGYEYFDDRMGASGNDADGTMAFSSSGANAYYPYTGYTYPHPLRGADETAPTILSVNSDKANGTYDTDDVIDIDVYFSEVVTSDGNVTVTLDTGQSCTFTVTSASSGTCNYTVIDGDSSADLTTTDISGTIADAASNAMSIFTPTTNLAANKDIVIQTNIAPSPPYSFSCGTISGGTHQ